MQIIGEKTYRHNKSYPLRQKKIIDHVNIYFSTCPYLINLNMLDSSLNLHVVYFDQQTVLLTPFSGQNQSFDTKTTFYVLFNY